MAARHPALARLDVLVGRWAAQPKVAGLGAAWTEFSWQDGGAFLRQVSGVDEIPDSAPEVWKQNAPFPTVSIIGLDDAADEFTMLYSDARDVFRVYRMTLADGEWRIWRDAPGFSQRFIGTLTADGNAWDARWEKSRDGVTWDLDFELRYTRES